MHSYTHVMVCRERLDGSLRGMMLIGIEHNKHGEQRYTLIKVRGLGSSVMPWELGSSAQHRDQKVVHGDWD